MHNYTSNIRLHNYKRKDGKRLIQLHSNVNGELSRIGLNIYVKPADFDKLNQVCKGQKYDYENTVIETYKSNAFELFKMARANNRKLTKERFEYLIENKALSKDFIAYYKEKARQEIIDKKLSESTVKKYQTVLNLLKKFSSRIEFGDINKKWLSKWNNFLEKQKVKSGQNKGKNYTHNTIVAIHTKVQKFISLAIDDLELNIKNPYKQFDMGWIETDKVFLTPVELSKLVQLYDLRNDLELPFHLAETLRMFLFMCGSGLRISDAGRLTGSHIVNDNIRIRTQKNRKFRMTSTFPLSQFSKRYLPEELTSDKIFSYDTSQSLNRNLKVIARYLNINKHLSSKVARHTFATSFIIAGGNVTVLKELLGHSDIKTTMVYVNITKEVERQELKLLDELLKFDQ